MRLVAVNALVFVALATLAAAGGEIYYRYVYDATDAFGLARTTADWMRRHYHFNRLGVRDSLEVYETAIPPGKRRVTFLGDSVTAGHGVPDVERRFANLVRKGRPDLEVHVIANNGWDTGGEIHAVRELAAAGYAFDRVVLVYFPNDIADLSPEWEAVRKRIYDAPDPGFLVRHSYLINTLYYRYRVATDRSLREYYPFVLEAYRSALWDEQARRLAELQHEVEARGGSLSVVVFPFLHAIEAYGPYRFVHVKLDRLFRERGVACLDLLGVFDGRKAAELVVSPRDAHPNERAHRMAAEAILAFLEVTTPRSPTPSAGATAPGNPRSQKPPSDSRN